jgi:hypothetical protein
MMCVALVSMRMYTLLARMALARNISPPMYAWLLVTRELHQAWLNVFQVIAVHHNDIEQVLALVPSR